MILQVFDNVIIMPGIKQFFELLIFWFVFFRSNSVDTGCSKLLHIIGHC